MYHDLGTGTRGGPQPPATRARTDGKQPLAGGCVQRLPRPDQVRPCSQVADDYRVPVQAGAGNGSYRVYVKTYDPATGTGLDGASASPVNERWLVVHLFQAQIGRPFRK
jgi:hypothetical protein